MLPSVFMLEQSPEKPGEPPSPSATSGTTPTTTQNPNPLGGYCPSTRSGPTPASAGFFALKYTLNTAFKGPRSGQVPAKRPAAASGETKACHVGHSPSARKSDLCSPHKALIQVPNVPKSFSTSMDNRRARHSPSVLCCALLLTLACTAAARRLQQNGLQTLYGESGAEQLGGENLPFQGAETQTRADRRSTASSAGTAIVLSVTKPVNGVHE